MSRDPRGKKMAFMSKWLLEVRCIARLQRSLFVSSAQIATRPPTRSCSSVALSEKELQVAESVLTSMCGAGGAPAASTEANPIALRKRRWTRSSRRTGVVATELGMTQLWRKDGTSVAVTVLQVKGHSS